jgi:hypothetical protein
MASKKQVIEYLQGKGDEDAVQQVIHDLLDRNMFEKFKTMRTWKAYVVACLRNKEKEMRRLDYRGGLTYAPVVDRGMMPDVYAPENGHALDNSYDELIEELGTALHSEDDRKIMGMLSHEMSVPQIAAALNRSEYLIRQAIKSIADRLKKRGNL